jgi:plasmid stabilization system protein ParE
MSQEPLALHPEAEQEYRDAYSWYRERRIPAAERFEDAVERALHQIQQSPDRWPSSHSSFRKYTLRISLQNLLSMRGDADVCPGACAWASKAGVLEEADLSSEVGSPNPARGGGVSFKIEFEQEEDGRSIAEISELPGVMAYGATQAEAEAAIEALAIGASMRTRG